MPPRGNDDGADRTAGAWAAAAVVLALGGLGFGVFSQFEVQDLQARVDQLERQVTNLAPGTTLVADDGGFVANPEPTESAPPADQQAVEAAFVALYDGSQPLAERLVHVDDATGVTEAFEAAGGSFAQEAASLRAEVDQVTFTSTATATVRYSLSTSSAKPVGRVGSARRVDGVWKVTRSTVCADLEAAGTACGG